MMAAEAPPDSMTSGYRVPWTRNRASRNAGGGLLEGADEELTDDPALTLGIGHSCQRIQEPIGGVDPYQIDLEVPAKGLVDLLRLAGAQQSVIHEHAGEAVPDRPMDQGCSHRRVDPSGEAADNAGISHPGPDGAYLLGDDRPAGPVLRRPARVPHEPLHNVEPVVGVDHLGVELDAIETELRVLHGRHRRSRGGGYAGKPVRRLGDGIHMAHPDILACRGSGQQQGVAGHVERGTSVLGLAGALHRAAQQVGQELVAVADAEHGDTHLQEAGVDQVGVIGVDRQRATG